MNHIADTKKNLRMLYLLLILFLGILSMLLSYLIRLLENGIYFIFILSFLLLLISFWLMQESINVFNIRHITIPAFFYFTYIIMIFIPSFLVYFKHPGPYRNVYLSAVYSVLITVPFGVLCANILFRFNRQEIKNFFHKPLAHDNYSGGFIGAFIIFLAIATVFVFLYIYEAKTIPLFYAIKNPGEFFYLSELRESSFKLLKTSFRYLYEWLRFPVFPFLISLSFGIYLNTRKKKWLMLFLITLMIGIFYCALSITKAHVAAILLTLFIFYYIYRAGKISISAMVLFLGTIFAFPLFVLLLITLGTETNIIKVIFLRLFYVPADVLYHYFEIFPDKIGYLYGTSIHTLSLLIGKEHFDTVNYVFRYMYLNLRESGYANAAFIGNLNADFGMVGVFFGGFLAGFLMQWINIYIIRKKKTILSIALYAILMRAFFMLSSTALPPILLSHGVILIFVIVLVISLLRNFLEVSTRPHTSSVDLQRGER